jgi:chemotaxis protein CheD
MQINISISDMKVSKNQDDILVTHALGSCIGLTIHDRKNFVGGMIHFMLPGTTNKNIDNPLMYAETGIPLLLSEFEKKGGKVKSAVLKAAGGALINDDKEYFNIGKKNILALKKILWKYNLLLESSDLGGDFYRTMRLFLIDGKVTCKNHIKGEWEI